MTEEAEERREGQPCDEHQASVDRDEGPPAVSSRAEREVDEGVEASREAYGRQNELGAAAPMRPAGVGPGPEEGNRISIRIKVSQKAGGLR